MRVESALRCSRARPIEERRWPEERNRFPVLLLHDLDSTWPPLDLEEAAGAVAELEAALQQVGHPVVSLPVCHAELEDYLHPFHPDEYIVFNWCEALPGLPHSEALVAQKLAALGFAYTGSTAATLALCWDKPRVKRLLECRGIPTPHWRVYHTPRAGDWEIFPAIVKPAREHCSYGINHRSVVWTRRELEDRIAWLLETFGQPALVEDFLDGREFHVSLWGNGHVQILPPAEMDFSAFDDPRQRLCDFDAKFTPDSPSYQHIRVHIPAPLRREEQDQLERIARTTYRATGCRDYARLDIRSRDGIFYVLDVNPNPDISADTSTALAAAEAGYAYSELGSRLVYLAASRHFLQGLC